MGDVHVFPIVQNEHVPANSDPKWQRSATTPVPRAAEHSRWSQSFPRKDSPAKMKRRCLECLWTRLWNPNPCFSSFERRYEWSTALFEHRKGASDPLRSLPGWPKAFGQSRACEADPLRSDLARSGHRSIAISPASMNTNGADLIDPWKVRHDRAWWSGWSPRVRGAQLSRNSRLLGGENFSSSHSPYHQTLSEIDQTYQSCSKTCLLEICRRRFLISQYFLFYATLTIEKYPLKRGFSTIFSSFR